MLGPAYRAMPGPGLDSASPTIGSREGTPGESAPMWTSQAGNPFFLFLNQKIQRKMKTTFSSIRMLSKCRCPVFL